MQPGQQKISQFDPITSMQSGDIIPVVRNGQNKRITVDNFSGIVPDGFTAAAQVWTFSSWNATSRLGVITVPSDATLKYAPGMWVRITQTTGGTKYGMITAVGATTLTVNFFSLYTLNNEAISTPYLSSLQQPFGAPKLPVKSTDANGWRVFDFGTYHEWTKKGQTTSTLAGSGWAFFLISNNMPVQLPTIGSSIGTGSIIPSDAAISETVNLLGTTVSISAVNNYGSTINNFTSYWTLRILEDA